MEKPRDKSPTNHHLTNKDESHQRKESITTSHRNNNVDNNNNNYPSSNRNQFPSVILFVSVIIMVNLCPFQHPSFEPSSGGGGGEIDSTTRLLSDKLKQETLTGNGNGHKNYLNHIETCGNFMRLMFTNPIRLNRRVTRFIQAEARMRRGRRQSYGYRRLPQAYMYNQQAPMYARGAAAANQIINHYRPSPPTFIDHVDGMYGQYNNAYGRQDGNYHLW